MCYQHKSINWYSRWLQSWKVLAYAKSTNRSPSTAPVLLPIGMHCWHRLYRWPDKSNSTGIWFDLLCWINVNRSLPSLTLSFDNWTVFYQLMLLVHCGTFQSTPRQVNQTDCEVEQYALTCVDQDSKSGIDGRFQWQRSDHTYDGVVYKRWH